MEPNSKTNVVLEYDLNAPVTEAVYDLETGWYVLHHRGVSGTCGWGEVVSRERWEAVVRAAQTEHALAREASQ